ncbi:MAG: YerC/YecD family TrpR-related protein [Clostridiales bacterium]|nr:YerC/YecD family TrpR-related protein [Clostridiales bacterium]MDD6872027.1 YerC/YecD family TrpR-related protein [Clostridiales bacterium]MDD7366301.1 YerC/YecD family TrpR-related protein [Clostridiales bacterium]MDY2871350.1 YerC/YecD family TrpR-related protein [Eubacteriales bacterium]
MQPMINEEQLKLLTEVLLSLKTEDEARSLLSDLCTIREMQDLGQRLEVARLLRRQMTYSDIAQQTGASTATISRVNRCLVYGAGGYRTVLERLEKGEDHD